MSKAENKNRSYFFVPFKYKNPADFKKIIEKFRRDNRLEQKQDEIKYMFNYVAEKMNSTDLKNCQCFHYILKDDRRNELNLAGKDDWFYIKPEKEPDKIKFQIENVQLYCFSTGVGIIAFGIHFESNDPLEISNAQYYLKKVFGVEIYRDGSDESLNLCTVSEGLIKEISKYGIDFFYYANRDDNNYKRANVFTYIEVEGKDDYKKELFYLRRCYGKGYLYHEDPEIDKKEIYVPSKDTIWGISPEAAVCLAVPDLGREEFLREIFYGNFNEQYMFMYVLLLHQKYVLYMFLTNIGIGKHNGIKELEDYRRRLYEFEADFVFSCVTEVPQYQNLYDKMNDAFSLQKMFNDVREPLVLLSEEKQKERDESEKERDKSVNRALLWISLLGIASALIDGMEFLGKFGGWFTENSCILRIIQACGIAGIIAIAVLVIKELKKSKK